MERLNQYLQKAYPVFDSKRRAKELELNRVKEEAQKLLSENNWSSTSKVFVDEQLQKLADSRRQLEEDLGRLRSELNAIQNKEMNVEGVQQLLQNTGEAILGDLKPYKRKELLVAAVKRFEISDEVCRAEVNLTSTTPDSEWSRDQCALPQPAGGANTSSHQTERI
jgi:septal ring factor EnvC (AmiA/AmiB activator)